MTDRILYRHLVTAVLIKLAVLLALWWAFVHDSKVPVDSRAAAERMGAPVKSMPKGARP